MATSRRKTLAQSPDAERAAEQASTLLTLAEQEPEAVVPSLEALSHDPRLARAVVAALGQVASPAAAQVLAAIADSRLGKELRKEARRGLHRLRAAGVEAPRLPAGEAEAPPPARARSVLYDAWATAPDGVLSRGLWLLAERPLGGIHALGLVVNGVVGLKAANFTETTRKRFEARLAGWREEEHDGWIQLPTEYAAQLVGEALSLNQRGGFPVPRDFQLNRDLIEGIERPFERAIVYREIGPGAARLAPDWLQQAPVLLEEPELTTWVFNFDVIRPFVRQLREARAGRLVITPQASPERQEAIVGEAIERAVTAEVRQGLKRSLEEVAYVFLRTDRALQARLAVAAAVALEEASVSRLLIQQPERRLDQHPFLRAMMVRSLQVAAQAEEAGQEAELEALRRSPYDVASTD